MSYSSTYFVWETPPPPPHQENIQENDYVCNVKDRLMRSAVRNEYLEKGLGDCSVCTVCCPSSPTDDGLIFMILLMFASSFLEDVHSFPVGNNTPARRTLS